MSVVRYFRHEWLSKYSPWLPYFQKMKAQFCIFCVLFHSYSGHGNPYKQVQFVKTNELSIKIFTKKYANTKFLKHTYTHRKCC